METTTISVYYSVFTSSESTWCISLPRFFTVIVGGVGQFPTTQNAEINALRLVSM